MDNNSRQRKKNTTKYWLTGLVTAVIVPKIPKLEVDHRFGDTVKVPRVPICVKWS